MRGSASIVHPDLVYISPDEVRHVTSFCTSIARPHSYQLYECSNSLRRAFPLRHPESPSTSKPRPFTFVPSTAPTKPNPCAQMSSMDFCIIQHLKPFMCCWPFAELWLEEPPPRPQRKPRKRRSGAKHTSKESAEVKVSEIQRRTFLFWFATARRACECELST